MILHLSHFYIICAIAMYIRVAYILCVTSVCLQLIYIAVSQLNFPTTSRYLQMGFQLPDITCQFAVGLEAATQAIYDAKLEIAEPSTLFKVVEQYTGRNIDFGAFDIAQKNAALASTIREVANERGWLAGWRCLTEACPNCGIHKDLMDDRMFFFDAFLLSSLQLPLRPLPLHPLLLLCFF